MTPEAAADRLHLSHTVLARWERMGGPTGPIADTVRILGAEIKHLEAIRDEHPDLADQAAGIIERYRAMMRKYQH